jgi:hypothetical protein
MRAVPAERTTAVIIRVVVEEHALRDERRAAMTGIQSSTPAAAGIVLEHAIPDRRAGGEDADRAAVELVGNGARVRRAAADREALDHRGARFTALDEERAVRGGVRSLAIDDAARGSIEAANDDVHAMENDVPVARTRPHAVRDEDRVSGLGEVDGGLDRRLITRHVDRVCGSRAGRCGGSGCYDEEPVSSVHDVSFDESWGMGVDVRSLGRVPEPPIGPAPPCAPRCVLVRV